MNLNNRKMENRSPSPDEKRASIIQHGNRKCRTHARVFSTTLAHGNSKNEIRQRQKMNMEEAKWAQNKEVPTA